MDCGTVNTPQNRHIVTPNISPPCDWTGKPRKGELVEVVVCLAGGTRTKMADDGDEGGDWFVTDLLRC